MCYRLHLVYEWTQVSTKNVEPFCNTVKLKRNAYIENHMHQCRSGTGIHFSWQCQRFATKSPRFIIIVSDWRIRLRNYLKTTNVFGFLLLVYVFAVQIFQRKRMIGNGSCRCLDNETSHCWIMVVDFCRAKKIPIQSLKRNVITDDKWVGLGDEVGATRSGIKGKVF